MIRSKDTSVTRIGWQDLRIHLKREWDGKIPGNLQRGWEGKIHRNTLGVGMTLVILKGIIKENGKEIY